MKKQMILITGIGISLQEHEGTKLIIYKSFDRVNHDLLSDLPNIQVSFAHKK